MEKKKNLSALTGLRFFAAFYVFIFHIYIRTDDRIPSRIIHLIINNGALGVNIFFMLSGLILFYNYYDKKIHWGEFMLKRLAKIYPVYLLGLLSCIAVGYITQTHVKDLAKMIIIDLSLLQSHIPHLSMKWYGGGAWSISTEFFFYSLSPFIILMIKDLKTKTLYILLAFAYIMSIVPGILFNMNKINFFLHYSFPISRLPEFLIGNIFATLIFIKNIKVSNPILLFILFISSIAFYFLGDRIKGYTIFNFFIIPVSFTIMYFLINNPKNTITNIIGGGIFEYLGKISYSFFIIQIPICFYIDYTLFLQEKNIILWTSIIFVINIILASIVYHLIEVPTHKFLNKKIKLLFK